jgi:hypothetical protein
MTKEPLNDTARDLAQPEPGKGTTRYLRRQLLQAELGTGAAALVL